MVEKSSDLPILSSSDPGAIPQGSQWVDMVEAGTVVAIEQPSGQTCAAVGGIMAARMKVRGVQACLVGGRVRDLAELKESGLPVSFPHLFNLLPLDLLHICCLHHALPSVIPLSLADLQQGNVNDSALTSCQILLQSICHDQQFWYLFHNSRNVFSLLAGQCWKLFYLFFTLCSMSL